jgi:hypothetical protein
MRYWIGFVTGACLVAASWIFTLEKEPSAEEAGRQYIAYRACIQRSTCKMTPQDWIDYYDLKWRLEEKEVGRND